MLASSKSIVKMAGRAEADAERLSEGGDSELIDKSQWSDAMRRWYESCNKAKMLVVGKSGVGKSTLINALLGEERAEVSETGTSPTTTDVSPYEKEFDQGVSVVLFDSPGLSDQSSRTADQKYIAKMREKCPVVQLVMVCVKMDDPRIREGDTKTLQALTAAFGKEIWKHVIIVLTQANRVECLRDSSRTMSVFSSRYANMKEELRQCIKHKLQVECHIPVVAAGHPFDYRLPVCEDWRAKVLTKCILQASEEAAVALLKPNLTGKLGKSVLVGVVTVPGALALGSTAVAAGAGVGVALGTALLVKRWYKTKSKVNDAKIGIQTASRHDMPT